MPEDTEKIVVAKPVASRPFSSDRPVSIPDSPLAIKPKSIRFRPKQNQMCPPTMDEGSESVSIGFSDKTSSKEGSNQSILYRPTPKLVARRSMSLFANQETTTSTHHQAAPEQPASSQNLDLDQPNYNIQIRSVPQYYSNRSSHPDTVNTSLVSDPVGLATQSIDQEKSHQSNSGSVDRPSYDGYNWRKYGQKQVKGSEFPRSYYKCTHPNCPVKKKVERTLEGKIAEIVYKGEHNHPKPQRLKRQQQNSTTSDNSAFDGNVIGTGSTGSAFEPRMDGQDEFSLSSFGSCYQGHDGSFASVSEFGGVSASADFDRPDFKRRKKDAQISGGSTVARGSDAATVQAPVETDVVGDGFHWRKYGQKVVKGNPYPRSYYRCTSPKCNVRKYVEKVSEESGSFVTTYEGRHNHEAPPRKTNSAIS